MRKKTTTVTVRLEESAKKLLKRRGKALKKAGIASSSNEIAEKAIRKACLLSDEDYQIYYSQA